MAEKILNARIVHKHDTELNWSKATNFIPKQGEIIVYDIDTNYTYERIKIGDGKTVVSALPFVDAAVLAKSKAYTDEKNEELSEGFSNVIYQMYGTDLTDAGAPTIRAIASDEADDALADAKAYTDSEIAEWVGDKTVSVQISAAIADKSDSGHTHDDRYYTESEINTKLNAKADVDHTHEISELTDLSGASVSHATTADSADEATHATTADTANAVAWANVSGKPSTYTPATHSHAISDVTNLQTTLDAKVPTSRTVNGKALSANITLSAADVGADASGAANTAMTNAKAYTDAEIAEWVGDKTVASQISTAVADKANKSEGAFFVEGSGTTDADAKTSTWVGTSDRITSYYDGLAIRYKIGVAGQTTTTLNINGLGAKIVYRFSTSKLTTHFPVGSIINLIYHADLNDGCWMCNDYDANTNTYQRVYSSTGNAEYPITARYNTTTGASYYAEYGRYSTGVTLNPSTKTITATAFKGKLTGNADTATKATQDASGNVITSTYATKAELDTLVGDTSVADQIAAAITYATDEEIYSMMIEEEALPVIQTEDGSVLCSAENEILMI